MNSCVNQRNGGGGDGGDGGGGGGGGGGAAGDSVAIASAAAAVCYHQLVQLPPCGPESGSSYKNGPWDTLGLALCRPESILAILTGTTTVPRKIL